MKKIVFTAIGVLMTGVMIFAQIRTSKTFAAFTAGPSYPVGLFSNTNIDEPNAGMAKNGFNIDVKLGHQFDQVFGITGGLTYGRYAVQDPHYYYYYSSENGDDVQIDPWQYYQVVAGPMISAKLSPRTNLDFSVLSGIALVTCPKTKYNGEIVSEQDRVATAPLKLGVDFRYRFNNAGYLFAGTSYQYMRPNFKIKGFMDVSETPGEGFDDNFYRFTQKMNTIGMNVGLGFAF